MHHFAPRLINILVHKLAYLTSITIVWIKADRKKCLQSPHSQTWKLEFSIGNPEFLMTFHVDVILTRLYWTVIFYTKRFFKLLVVVFQAPVFDENFFSSSLRISFHVNILGGQIFPCLCYTIPCWCLALPNPGVWTTIVLRKFRKFGFSRKPKFHVHTTVLWSHFRE